MAVARLGTSLAWRSERPMKFDDRPFIAFWEMTQACDLVMRESRARPIGVDD
jgi:hypothetical protein